MTRYLGTLPLALALLAGCGGNTTTVVTGKVCVNGEPLENGFVVLYGPTGACVSTSIVDGSYEVRLPPRGDVTVVIFDETAPTGPDTGPRKQGRGIVPARYRSQRTSPLKLQVKEGMNALDIELTSDAEPSPKRRR